ncbi:MAG TPA: tetratricopeptide repeat protein [Candidatus Baltobacteraceae bacterium]|jgi:tetratricopeptide (TPR) repeat protein|nr:tetratricopeptide repeat protein [Candidatus Baltobacteraceae bacterium]
MLLRTFAAALIVFAAGAGIAAAQTYGTSTPPPRTTDVHTLRALAQAREVHERFTIGLDAERRGQWAAAAAEFERIITLHPPEPQFSTAYYDAGIAYAHLNRMDDAARSFRAAIAGDPQFLAAMANLIAVDLARGDLSEARSVADRFVALAPDSARAQYSRGIVALRQGDFGAARRSFGQLLQADPQYALAHYNLAIAQAGDGQYPSAEHELRIALDLAPSYGRARFALGTVLLHEGKRAQAREAFDAVARDAAGDAALRNLAVAMRDAIRP